MAKLMYPPIVEPTTAAFAGGSLTVPFTVNRTVNMSEVDEIWLMMKSTITNEPIINTKASSFTNNSATFSGLTYYQDLQAGGFYKIQIAFKPKKSASAQPTYDDRVGHYSTVSLVKYLGEQKPTLDIQDEISNNNVIVGTYINSNDLTEKLRSYTFTLKNSEGKVLETSGERLHNSTEDTAPTQVDTWSPTVSLSSGYAYTVEFSITTINGYTDSKTQTIAVQKDESGYVPRNIELFADMDEENGFVNITIRSTISAVTRQLIYGKFRIYRVSSKDNFTERYLVAYFSLENQDIFEKSFKDFTVEAGFKYRYILQQVNDYGIHSEEIWSQGDLECNYEHLFLFDGKRQLKVKFNPKMPNFKTTILESKIDTIGGQYPFIFRNENVMYKELSLSGLISYQMDEQNLFIDDDEIWPYLDEGMGAKEKWTHNLLYDNITAEREFKLKVLNWLNNGEIKLLKSPTEGNYIIRLLNVSLAPTDSLGRMLHTFSATAYEVDDVDRYQFTEGLTVDKTHRYVGYKTNPLYDFPKSRLLTGGTSIITDYSQYEIILNPHLEYVTGVHFEDVKPRTPFEVTMERNGEEIVHRFRIGATGFYAIPSELGYHIKKIRLALEKWETDDFAWDIINNRGQVTYEFEKQAKHNNFNDITKITSDIVIAAPMNSSYTNATVQEPLTTTDGNSLYEYQVVASEEALIELGYFYTEDTQPSFSGTSSDSKPPIWVRGVDYVYDDKENKYYKAVYSKDQNNNTIITQGAEIFPYKNAYFRNNQTPPQSQGTPLGLFYAAGTAIPKLETVENPTLATEDKAQYYPFTDNKTSLYALDNEMRQVTIDNKSGKQALLFVHSYDSRGIQQIERVVEEEEGYLQNPYYSYCGRTAPDDTGAFAEPVYVDLYKTVPVLSVGPNQTSKMGTQKIFRNFVTNKYYDATNVNGEYYIKEEIQNIYNLSFEIVPVFYESNYEDNKPYTGNVIYEDIEENMGYTHIRRLTDLIYDNDEFLTTNAAEMYYDYVDPDVHGIASNFIENSWIRIDSLMDMGSFNDRYQQLYNIPQEIIDSYKADGKAPWEIVRDYFWYFKLYKRDTTDVMGVYRYYLYTTNTAPDDDTIRSLYVNPRIQGFDNYIAATTPADGEVVIVYTDNPNHIEHIDLTNRLSYNISAEDFGQEDLRNIAAVYIGKCVRGFMTYKRKQYSYRAVLDDGLVVDLTPDTYIKQSDKEAAEKNKNKEGA